MIERFDCFVTKQAGDSAISVEDVALELQRKNHLSGIMSVNQSRSGEFLDIRKGICSSSLCPQEGSETGHGKRESIENWRGLG